MPPAHMYTPRDASFMHDVNSRGVLGAISQSAWNLPRSNESQRRTVGARDPSAGKCSQTSRPLGANALLEGSVASPRVGHDFNDHPLVPDKDLWGPQMLKNDVLRVDTAWENRYDSDRAFVQRVNSTSSSASSLEYRDRTDLGQLGFAVRGGVQVSAQSSLSQRVLSPSCPPSQQQQQQQQLVSHGTKALKYDHSSLSFGPTIKAPSVQSMWDTNLSRQPAMGEHQAFSGASMERSDSSLPGVAAHSLATRRRHDPFNRPIDTYGWSELPRSDLTDQSEMRQPMSYPRPIIYAGSQYIHSLSNPLGTMTMSGAEPDCWSDTNMSYNRSSSLTDYATACNPTTRSVAQSGGFDAHEDMAYNMPRSACRTERFSNRNTPDSAISLSRHSLGGNYPSYESRVQPGQARAGMSMMSPTDWMSINPSGTGRLLHDNANANNIWPQAFHMPNGLCQQDVMSVGQTRDRFRAQPEQDIVMSGYSYSPQMIISPETSGFRSRLLEDFKSKSKGSRRWDLREIYNHIPEFAGDQLGSRFIQEKLETANSEEKARVFAELLPCAPQLSVCVFGNYVIQKFFEHGDQLQKKQLANTLRGRVVYNSLNTYGCRVVQKALEHILLPQQLSLIEELRSQVIKCVMNQNGNHVIAMALEQIPAQHVRFVVESFFGHIQQLSADKYACRIVQRLLERGEDVPRRIIMRELLTCASQLIANDYGNYVVQELVQHGSASDKAHIFDLVQANLIVFCRHKFASNVVERCLVFGTDADRRHVLRQLTVRAGDVRSDSILSTLARDQFGNYVVQRLLETLSEPENEQYAVQLAPEVAKARRFGANKYLDEVEKCLYRFANRKDERCKAMTCTPTPPLTADGTQTPRTSSVLSHTEETSQALAGAAFTDPKQMPTIEISEATT